MIHYYLFNIFDKNTEKIEKISKKIKLIEITI